MCFALCFSGSVTGMHTVNCNTISWDLPNDGGLRILDYRVRVYSGRTYASSRERRVFKTSDTTISLTWLPTKGPVVAIVSDYT